MGLSLITLSCHYDSYDYKTHILYISTSEYLYYRGFNLVVSALKKTTKVNKLCGESHENSRVTMYQIWWGFSPKYCQELPVDNGEINLLYGGLGFIVANILHQILTATSQIYHFQSGAL